MQKKSFFNIAIVGGGNGINALLGFLFFTAVARTLTIEDFGKYALITSLLVSLSKLIDFGTNSNFVAKSITKAEDYTNRFFSLKIILFFVASFISLLTLYFLNLVNSRISILFIFGLLAYGINITLFAYFQRLEKFVDAVLLNTIPSIIKAVAATLVFLGVFQPNLTQAFAIFSLSIFGSVFLVRKLPRKFLVTKFSTTGVKKFFKQTFAAGASQIIKESWLAIANSIVKLTKTFSDLGIFSLAHKIADIFMLVSMSIFTVLLPKNAQRKKIKERYNIKETGVIAIGILILSLIVMYVAQIFVVPVFGAKFEPSLDLLNILILASAVTAIHSFMDNFFFVEEKTKTLLNITVLKLIFFVSVSLALIPQFSVLGIAFADLGAAIFALLLTLASLLNRE